MTEPVETVGSPSGSPLEQTLATCCNAWLKEQRKTRRWKIFWKVLFWGVAIACGVWIALDQYRSDAPRQPHTARINIVGGIDAENLDTSAVIARLHTAFTAPLCQGVVIYLNSPGGSPTQAGWIYEAIRALRLQYPDKKTYAVIGDVGASAAYLIAAAAENIYAHPASIVGSIGVLMPGMDAQKAAEKIGIADRTLTAGAHKYLSPLRPMDLEDATHLQSVLDSVHAYFIHAVEQGRQARIAKADKAILYSGWFWSGQQALELGLIDGFGTVEQVAKDQIGAAQVEDYSVSKNLFDQMSRRFGAAIHQGVLAALQCASGVQGAPITT